MNWSGNCEEPWQIEFVPVRKSESETLPLTSVIVISVSPCPGGAFVEEPESYHVVSGKVEKIPFETWIEKVKTSYPGVPKEIRRKEWSSKKSEDVCTRITQVLMNSGDEEGVEESWNTLHNQENQNINTNSIKLFHPDAAKYRQGGPKNVEMHLAKLADTISKSNNEECWITILGKVYFAAVRERLSGNHEKSWEIIKPEAFQQCFDVPAGLIPAAFYAHAAAVLM